MTTANSEKARHISLLIIDIDGVLTDGGLLFDNRGEEYKRFNSLDGHGIRMLMANGVEVAIITGRQSRIVEHRMHELGVKRIYQGSRDKLGAFQELLRETGLEPAQVAYIGDDLPDLPIMRRVELAIAVQNAHGFVKQHSDWVTSASGGHGAVREVTDFILHSKGLLEALQESYLE